MTLGKKHRAPLPWAGFFDEGWNAVVFVYRQFHALSPAQLAGDFARIQESSHDAHYDRDIKVYRFLAKSHSE